ncbi:MAG: site-2 protease family protein [Chloroflexi bacterium]|nr:site-2 protease family protein [Chloroflexota bacterium]MQC17095.1 site-2 protease family protein [Chloroflexota bacterium]
MDLSGGLKIARIRGIDILVHWSWALIFTLVTWSLSGYFASEFAGWSEAQAWVAGVLAALGFFTSVLLHELSHAIVAQRFGMSVPSITLFVFGGVSNIAGEMRSARNEFFIAAAGPAMSLLLALLLSVAGAMLGGPPGEVVLYLGVVNGLLGVFNLLPGFPLDGGRVFRSIVWGRTKDLTKATRWASLGGQAIAWVMILSGVWVALTVSLTGLWYVLIGLFLKQAAEASYQQMMLDQSLRHVQTQRLMRPAPTPLPEMSSLQRVVDERVLAEGERCVLLDHDGRVTGLLTVTDLRKFPREEWPTTSARNAMVPAAEVATVEPTTPVNEALRLMAERDVHQLPVIEGAQLVGILTRGDILNHLQMREQFGDLLDARARDG